MSKLTWMRSRDRAWPARGYEYEAVSNDGSLVFLVYALDVTRRKWGWTVHDDEGQRIYISISQDGQPKNGKHNPSARAARAAAQSWLEAKEAK